MSDAQTTIPSWDNTRSRLCQAEPGFYELEPGGALAMPLGEDGWMLELTPDGRMICQTGMDIDDIKSLLSEGTPEDLGTDELAKQAKYYLQPAVAKVRKVLIGAGFEETTEMNDQYVAVTFHKPVDFQKLDEVKQVVQWCQQQFTRKT